MAWAFGAAGAIADGDAAGDLSTAFPSGISAGHLLICGCYSRSGDTDFDTPTDFDFLLGTGPRQLAIYGKIATGSESGNLAVPMTGGSSRVFAQIARFTGAPASISGIVHASAVSFQSGTVDITVDALTISENDTLVYTMGGKQVNGSPYTPPSVITEIGDGNNSGGDNSSFVAGYEIQTTMVNFIADIWDTANVSTATDQALMVALTVGSGIVILRRRREE